MFLMTSIFRNSNFTYFMRTLASTRNAATRQKSHFDSDARLANGWQSKASIAIVVFALFSSSQTIAQSGKSDFLLFASGEYADRSGDSSIYSQSSDFTPAADLLYTYTNGPWRVLGEYYLTDDESELERIQLGYEATVDTTLWIGRFHQPISAWNSKYHHGAYLQPSITRPSIENWEDEGGVLPAHASGLMVDSATRLSGGDGFRYTASIGLGPSLSEEGLHPYDPASGDPQENGHSASMAFSYYPDFVGSANFGILAGYSEIKVLPSPIWGNASQFDIEQLVIGVQIDWQWDRWQLISAAYYVDNHPDDGFAQFGGSFISAYVQALRQIGTNKGIYARIEGGHNTKSAGYLELFPLFITQRLQIGGRLDFGRNQALAIELSAGDTVNDDFTEIRLQWSSVFQ
jgi:hypothetical protein